MQQLAEKQQKIRFFAVFLLAAVGLFTSIGVAKQSAGRSDFGLRLENSQFLLPIICLTQLSVFQSIIFYLVLQTEDVFTKSISALM